VRVEDSQPSNWRANTDASVASREHADLHRRAGDRRKAIRDAGQGVRALFPELERNLPPSMKMKVLTIHQVIQSSIDEVERRWAKPCSSSSW